MIKVAVIGDFNSAYYTHTAINDSFDHAENIIPETISYKWIHTSTLQHDPTEIFENFNRFWIASGSPYSNMQGVINIIKHARENDVPLLAICGGFQHLILEYAWNVLGKKEVAHEEISPEATEHIIKSLPCSLVGQSEELTIVDKNSITYRAMGKEKFTGSYHCSFGLNLDYKDIINDGGCNVVVENKDGEVRGCEIKNMQFFVGSLFQPQLHSSNDSPNPLLLSFFKAATG